ncbi:alpha-galactosidase [Streptomyces sp. 549]|uniref:alpha-galactosidase n=1 Tax=Streptomyces sp. 549 TaxID=3049076 RepID=UPI0024C28E99|nr:alpha-galactosidase [Streptomyces sp. 549]MDK1476056.1 alpha-galactosidase [Streptomyces sp. 549]
MPLAQYDPADGLLLLTAGRSSYAVRLDPAARSPRLVHWGARITPEDARALPLANGPDDSFAGPWDATEELPVEAGPRYGPPAVTVRFADGGHLLDPALDGCTVHEEDGRTRAVVTLSDRRRPFAWELHYTVRPGSDVVERRVRYRHTGGPQDGPIVLTRWSSAQWTLPHLEDYRLSSVHGGWGTEGRLTRTPLPFGETTLTSRRGHTGHDAGPWAVLDDGSTGEDHGEAWTVQLATSGSWRMTVQRTADGRCAVTAGAGHEGVEQVLDPGESLLTPLSAAARTAGGFGAAGRAQHRWLREHVLPRPEEVRPVLYNSWEATGFEVTEDNQRALAERAAAMGVELFVVDDGWFGRRDDDRAGLGDWTPHHRRFPQGLRPLADHVHTLGMRFGLWVEPEMFNADSDLHRTHPDWTAHTPGPEPTPRRNQLMLDFTRDDVVDWATEVLSTTVRDNGVDFLKWDFNRSVTEGGGAPGAARSRYVHHAEGFHEVLDRLRSRFPDLRVESCAGGGGRVDAAVLRRTDQVWPSDNTDPVDRLAIQDGFTQVWPAAVMSSWVTDSPNFLTGRRTPLRFRFHAAMAGVLGVGGDLMKWSPEQLAEAADLVAAYKQVRHLVQHGDHHRLRRAAPGRSDAVAYVRADGGEAAVLVRRPDAGFHPAEPPLRVPGLRADAVFTVDAASPGSAGASPGPAGASLRLSGAALAAHGLPVELPPGEYRSALVWLRGNER